MRRIVLWLTGTVVAVVVLFLYRTSTAGGPQSSATATAGAALGGGRYLGAVTPTRWGPVQVEIAIGKRVSAGTVPVFPANNGEDQQINARALPVLIRETLTAQSAHIDTVSGATVTSAGYLTSLQSALATAHLQ